MALDMKRPSRKAAPEEDMELSLEDLGMEEEMGAGEEMEPEDYPFTADEAVAMLEGMGYQIQPPADELEEAPEELA